MDEETRRINRLLSGGKLSGPEADEILERALSQLAREKQAKVRPIRYWGGAALAVAAAAAILLVVGLPRAPGGQVHVPESGELGSTKVSVTCSPGTLAACPKSGKLVFSLSGKRASGFLSAYAESVGPEAPPVFYFSEQDGSAKLALPAEGGQAAQRAVRLPEAQAAGRYRVHAVLAARPLRREEMVELAAARAPGSGILARSRVEVVVTE